MKKFINKNRQKRKYVRKVVATERSSFSNSLPIGIIPMLLIGIALLMIAFVSNNAVDSYIESLTLPAISFPSFPNITIPQISIVLPMTTLGAMLSALNPVPALQSASETTTGAGAGVLQSLMQFFAAIGLGILSISNAIIQSIILGMQSIGIFIWQGITDFVTLCGVLINGIFHGLIAHGVLVWKSIVWIVSGIAHLLQILLMGIIGVFQTIFHAMDVFLDKLFFAISWPFKTVWGYLVQTKPFWIIFGALIKDATQQLGNGFTTLGNSLSELMKAAK